MTDEVDVWLDADFLERKRVGALAPDCGTVCFAYDPLWLENPQAFALDPDLSQTLRIARADIELSARVCGVGLRPGLMR